MPITITSPPPFSLSLAFLFHLKPFSTSYITNSQPSLSYHFFFLYSIIQLLSAYFLCLSLIAQLLTENYKITSMASLGNPRSWAPYINTKDCSLGFCSLYCPQWCYTLYPPPPPPPFEFPHQNSTPNLSPLVIAIIGILASAFLLVSYYTLISKYCGNNTQSSSHPENHHNELEDTINHNPSLHEPWQVSHTCGLDEALIKSITICKYKKGDGLVGVAECSVCLSEFEDDESIRLLPKCSHAFHLPCIDTWLKSHSSCPLCRSPIFTFNASDSSLQLMHIPSQENHHQNENLGAARDNIIEQVVEEESRESSSRVVKPALRAFSDLQGRHRVIEIREEGYEYDESSIRRSVSMDHSFQRGAAVANVVVPLPQHMNQVEEEECTEEAGPSKANYRRRVLNCVLSPSAMKRSFSSGRFSFSLSRNGRG